jgi:hypothetical protein
MAAFAPATGAARALYSTEMPSLRALGRRAAVLALVPLAGAGCGRAPADAASSPPTADFVMAAGDSAFWITSTRAGLTVRGAPLELAQVDGRFYELYVADDDRSFQDATFVGQRVYRRDLVRGDSALVYEDTLVPHLAREYARRHPEDAPLRPDGQTNEEPLWTATSTLDLTGVHGPFVSFELHTDVDRDDSPQWHTTRRGVLDLRGQDPVALAAVAGADAPAVERQRAVALRAALDSVRGSGSALGMRAAAALGFYHLDPASFALTTLDGAPAVAYALVGAGDGDAGLLLPLAPIRIGEPAWWTGVLPSLPIGSANGSRDVWRHRRYEIVVRYDSAAATGQLALRDSTSREWPVTRVPAPATRVFWLDSPAIDLAARSALARAFDESTLYDESLRTASYRGRPRARRARAGLRRGARHVTPPRTARPPAPHA